MNTLADPSLHVRNLRPLVSDRSLDRRKLREAHTKTHIVRILLHNDVFGSCWYWGVLEELKESLASERPAFLVLLSKGNRICQGLRKRNDCGLSIERPYKFLRIWKDDVEVKGNEKTK